MATSEIRVQIVGDASKLQKEFNKAARGAAVFNARIEGTFRGLSRGLGFAAAAGGVASLGLAIRSTVNASIAFEDSFAGVRKTVDATEPEFRELAAGFRGMARDIPVAVTEINKIGESAGQLGVAKDAILDFTRTIADLSVTTDLTADAAADSFARLANITGLPQDEFDRLGATVVDLGNKLAATETEIVNFALRVAGAGKQVRLSEAQILAISGAFTSVGIEAEAGGTAVSKVLGSLQSAVLTGGKALEQFAAIAGQSASDFRTAFEQDAAGAFTRFVEGLESVRRQGGNVFQVLKDLGLTDQRLTRAFLSIAGAGDLLARSLDIGSTAFRQNTALVEEAEKRYKTSASQLQVFQNRVNDLQIAIGDALVPVLLDVVTPLSEWLANTENQREVQRKLNAVLEDSRAIISGVSDVIIPLGRGVREAADAVGGLQQAVKLLTIALVVNKVTNYATALTGLGTQAAVATGRVNALRAALLRLGAIGVIAVAVEIVLNREAIDDFVRGKLPAVLGGKSDAKLPVDPVLRVQGLRKIRAELVDLVGSQDKRVKALDAAIGKLLNRIEAAKKTTRPDDRLEPRGPGAVAAENREIERAAEAAARAIQQAEAAQANLTDFAAAGADASTKAANAAKKEADAKARALEIERQRLRVQQQRRQGELFEALGLTSGGEQRVAGIGAIRNRASNLIDQLKASGLDPSKIRETVRRISVVFKKEFDGAGRNVRQAILDMFNQIASALESGTKLTDSASGEITRGGIRSTQALLRGVEGLTAEQRRKFMENNLGVSGRRGLSAFGFALSGGTSAQAAASFGGAAGATIIHIHGDVRAESADQFIRDMQKRAGRHSGSRRGRHGGARLGLQ